MANDSVLITGGAGFIGRELVRRCLEEGHRVTVIDDLCAGRIDNIRDFLDSIEFHEMDVRDRAGVAKVIEASRPDTVFHLAAHHFIPFCDQHPDETLSVNVSGTHVVLSEAAKGGARTAVVASSGVLYPSVDDILDEDIPVEPIDIYGLSKLMTEQVARYVATATDMSCVAARLFNTYGPYETNPHLIPHIMECLHRGPSIPLGNIHTKRDYIYVEDTAELIYRSARARRQKYTVVNVGTGVEYSAEDIVRTLGDLLGTEITIDVDTSRVRAVDKIHQRAGTARLEQLTGTRARHDLRDGLRKLLEYEGLVPVAH